MYIPVKILATAVACFAILLLSLNFLIGIDALFSSGYSRIALSDFGVLSPTSMIFNVGMIVTGISTSLIGVLKNNRTVIKNPSVYIILGGFCIVGIGLVPYSVSVLWHWFFAIGAFLAFFTGGVLYYLYFTKRHLSLKFFVVTSILFVILVVFVGELVYLWEIFLILLNLVWMQLYIFTTTPHSKGKNLTV